MAKGGMRLEGGMHGKKGRQVWRKGVCVAGEAATAVGGMHPTRIHSC